MPLAAIHHYPRRNHCRVAAGPPGRPRGRPLRKNREVYVYVGAAALDGPLRCGDHRGALITVSKVVFLDGNKRKLAGASGGPLSVRAERGKRPAGERGFRFPLSPDPTLLKRPKGGLPSLWKPTSVGAKCGVCVLSAIVQSKLQQQNQNTVIIVR